jgi:hypothetical protein
VGEPRFWSVATESTDSTEHHGITATARDFDDALGRDLDVDAETSIEMAGARCQMRVS